MVRLHLPPGSPMFQYRIENRQQLPHARSERDLLRFARSLQALIEGSDHRIESGGDDGVHIEDGADLCTSAPHCASPAERAAIAIEWRDADEGGDLLVRQCARFRKTRQQGRSHHGAYARHTLQEIVLVPPRGAVANRFRQRRVGVLELPFKPGNMSPDALADRRGCAQEAILFGRQHLDHLPSPGQQRGQCPCLRIRKRSWLGAHHLRKLRQHLGIQGIGLRQPPTGFGKVPYLSGIDDDYRQAGGGKRTRERNFHPARRF